MLRLLNRKEVGYKSIGLCWHDAPWARKAIEFICQTPTLGLDPAKPFRFVIEMKWGPGAGYKNGYTAYLGINCKDRTRGGNIYLHKFLQIGFTQNANLVPYPY